MGDNQVKYVDYIIDGKEDSGLIPEGVTSARVKYQNINGKEIPLSIEFNPRGKISKRELVTQIILILESEFDRVK